MGREEDGKKEEKDDVNRYWITVRKMENTGNWKSRITWSHSAEKSLWKRLWTCRKSDYRM